MTQSGLAVETGKGHLEYSQKLTESCAYKTTGQYNNSVRPVCQAFSFATVSGAYLGSKKRPGDRLKESILEMGLSYSEFGKRVAEAQTPPRSPVYKRNNVMEWIASRAKPTTDAWLAIEKVTGKTITWFLHGIVGEKPVDRQLP